MADTQTTISPHSQKEYVTRTYPSAYHVDAAITAAAAAQETWKGVPLKDRLAICSSFLDGIQAVGDDIAMELTLQMGR